MNETVDGWVGVDKHLQQQQKRYRYYQNKSVHNKIYIEDTNTQNLDQKL